MAAADFGAAFLSESGDREQNTSCEQYDELLHGNLLAEFYAMLINTAA
jgi:hypothetical protein